MVNTFLVKLIAQYFPNYATLHSGLDFSPLIIAEIAFAFTLGRLMYFILGRFWKNNLRRYLYSFSIAFIGIMLLIWVKEVSIIIIIFAICGFIFGHNYAVSLDLLLVYETKEKSTKAGLFESSIGLGSSLAPVIAGLLAEIYLQLPFLVFGMVDVVLILFLVWIRIKKPESFQA